jgi:hypothetical protein
MHARLLGSFHAILRRGGHCEKSHQGTIWLPVNELHAVFAGQPSRL